MRALRRSPLFRTALLSLAVLFAHTGHATTRPIVPIAPACPGKVAAAQPDPEKKPALGIKRIALPGRVAAWHNLFGGAFGFTSAHASLFAAHSAAQLAAARWAVYVSPQHSPFVLRI